MKKMLFPIFSIFSLGWLFKLMGTSFDLPIKGDNYYPSKSFMDLRVAIESYRRKAYRDANGVVTVGDGITLFKDGTKPILGKVYSDSFLLSQSDYILSNKLRSLKKHFGYMTLPTSLFDLILYYYWNGFSYSRAKDLMKYLSYGMLSSFASKRSFESFVFSYNGVGGVFFGSKISALGGMLRARYIMRNHSRGKPLKYGLKAFMSQFPRKSNGSLDQQRIKNMFFSGQIDFN